MSMIMIWRHVHVLLISQYWLLRVNIHSKSLESLDHRAPWLGHATINQKALKRIYVWYQKVSIVQFEECRWRTLISACCGLIYLPPNSHLVCGSHHSEHLSVLESVISQSQVCNYVIGVVINVLTNQMSAKCHTFACIWESDFQVASLSLVIKWVNL